MSEAKKPHQSPNRPRTGGLAQQSAPFRADILRAAALAFLTFLVWCAAYNRWSPGTWSIPISYPHPFTTEDEYERGMELAKGDVMQQFAIIKAASDGHILPVAPTNIPELGAPYVANWDDYPFTEKAIYWVIGIVAKFTGIFTAANFATLLEDVLAALAFYTACRALGASWLWAFTGGIVFAFSRFGFSHGIHHIPTAYVWHLPLCLLVFHWIARGEGIRFRTQRFIFALAVGLITGVQNPYNTNMFCQLVLIGGVVAWWRTGDWKQWRAGLPALCVIGAAAAGFIFVNSNTFLYHLLHGGNPGAVVRPYKWLEIYGLKLVDMVMPPPDHRFGPLAFWARNHLTEIVLQPGETPPSGYLGIVGLAALAWLAVASLRRLLRGRAIPPEALIVLWIYLYADVGGMNGVIGTLGFMLFRATTRYSVWILCIALMFGVRRLSAIDFKQWIRDEYGDTPWADWFPYCAAFVFFAVALFDQTPPVPSSADLQKIASAVESDRDFAVRMERSLPSKAMVFQLPVMEFPESPGVIGAYDNFRPYLFSNNLRYTFGTDKGRGTELWQEQVIQMPQFIAKLEQYGFAGLYVNRFGFRDGVVEGIVEKLKSLGYTNFVESKNHDLISIGLKPSRNPIRPDADPEIRPPLPPGN